MGKKIKWSFEKCKEIASHFLSRVEFQKKYPSTYSSALKNKWLDDICNHMKRPISAKLIWTFEKCKEEALKYKSRNEFGKYSISAYNRANINNWMDEICSHMINIGHKYKRMVYIYEFPDNSVYIGLTCNIEKRNKSHMNDSGAVYNHIKKTGLIPTLIIGEYIDAIEAQKLEGNTIIKYRNNKWIILNSKKAGDLGGNNLIWTFEKCKEEALKYNNKKEFREKSNSCYVVSLKNKWLNKIIHHFIEIKKIPNFWNYANCKEEALKYYYRSDFRDKSNGAYISATKNGWLDEICLHMKRKPKNF